MASFDLRVHLNIQLESLDHSSSGDSTSAANNLAIEVEEKLMSYNPILSWIEDYVEGPLDMEAFCALEPQMLTSLKNLCPKRHHSVISRASRSLHDCAIAAGTIVCSNAKLEPQVREWITLLKQAHIDALQEGVNVLKLEIQFCQDHFGGFALWTNQRHMCRWLQQALMDVKHIEYVLKVDQEMRAQIS